MTLIEKKKQTEQRKEENIRAEEDVNVLVGLGNGGGSGWRACVQGMR